VRAEESSTARHDRPPGPQGGSRVIPSQAPVAPRGGGGTRRGGVRRGRSLSSVGMGSTRVRELQEEEEEEEEEEGLYL